MIFSSKPSLNIVTQHGGQGSNGQYLTTTPVVNPLKVNLQHLLLTSNEENIIRDFLQSSNPGHLCPKPLPSNTET